MNSKKAQGLPFRTVVVAVILLIFLVVFVFIFTDLFGEQSRQTKCKITSLDEDYDKDGIVDGLDSCPCKFGVDEKNGCPLEAKPEDKNKDCVCKDE